MESAAAQDVPRSKIWRDSSRWRPPNSARDVRYVAAALCLHTPKPGGSSIFICCFARAFVCLFAGCVVHVQRSNRTSLGKSFKNLFTALKKVEKWDKNRIWTVALH